MDTDRQKFKRVTKILADLDLLFSTKRNPQEETFWILTPFAGSEAPKPEETVSIELVFSGMWLNVSSFIELKESPGVETLSELLKLSSRLAFAKVSLIELPGSSGLTLVVSAQIVETHLDEEMLKVAIGAVVTSVPLVGAVLRGVDPKSLTMTQTQQGRRKTRTQPRGRGSRTRVVTTGT